MATSFTLGVFLSEFLTNLRARFAGISALSSVTVELVPTGDTTSIDVVTLISRRITGRQDRNAFGVRSDYWTVPGTLLTYGTDPDASTAFQKSLDRAGLVMDEIQKEIRDTRPPVGLQTLDATLTLDGVTPILNDRGGWYCQTEFQIEYTGLVL